MKIKIFCLDQQIRELDLNDILSEGEECFIGRSPNSAITLEHPKVSRLHAKLFCQDGQYFFCDLGSGNGSVVGDESVTVNQNYLLQPGDKIQIADFTLLLELSEQAEELLESDLGDREIDITPEAISDEAMPDEAIPEVIAHAVDTASPEVAVPILQFEESDQDLGPAIKAEVVDEEEPLAIVRVEPAALDESAAGQTKALLAALNQRVLNEIKTAGHLTRETYLKAVQKARESLEQNKLIDPEQFEQEAEKYWQSLSKGTSQLGVRLGSAAAKGATQLGNRLGAAAKAAWREFSTSQSDETKQQDLSNSEANPELRDQDNNDDP